MNKLILILMLAALLSSSISVSAQDDEFDLKIEQNEEKLINRGTTGAYGTTLSKLANFISLNGYANNELHIDEDEITFDQHIVNLFVTAELSGDLTSEVDLTFLDGGEDFGVQYAFLDYKFSDAFIIRGGKFLLPTSDFNENSSLGYLNHMVGDPLTSAVSPTNWAAVGVQIRGKLGSKEDNIRPFYAGYVVNGLSQPTEEGEEDEHHGFETLINELAEHGQGEDSNKKKDFGLQLGAEFGENLFASAYYHTSKYDSAEVLSLGIYGVSAGYNSDKLYIVGEYHAYKADITNELSPTIIGETEVSGFYLTAGYKINNRFEPVVRFESVTMDNEDTNRITGGINYWFGNTKLLKLNVGQFDTHDENIIFAEFGMVFSF